MKKIVCFIVLFLGAQVLCSQCQAENEIAKQIDEQIWTPFKEAYDSKDAEKFNSLHSEDVLRITKSGIRQGITYKSGNIRSFSREDRPKRTIDLGFEHRLHSDSVAYEVGYYRVVKTQPDSADHVSYGRFHVVLKKIDDSWRITLDWDIDNVNGVPVTSEDFEKLVQQQGD